MANINELVPLLFRWEGGYVNDPDDRGGHTNRGVTLNTWRAHGYDINGDSIIDLNDLKQITQEDAVEHVLRPHYWNRWQADHIRNQSIANLLVGWVWGSGKYGITIPQGILGVKEDGIVGPKTLNAVNNYPDQEELFYRLWHGKRAYLHMICSDRPQNKKFLRGWLNRLSDYKWFPVLLIACVFALSSCRSVKVEENRKTGFHQSRITDSVSSEKIAQESILKDIFSTFTVAEEQNDIEILKRTYDLSFAPDSLTGNYPVREEMLIQWSNTKKSAGLSTDTLSLNESEYGYRESLTDSRENVSLKTEESEKRESTSKLYVWGILLVLVAGVVCLVFKN